MRPTNGPRRRKEEVEGAEGKAGQGRGREKREAEAYGGLNVEVAALGDLEDDGDGAALDDLLVEADLLAGRAGRSEGAPRDSKQRNIERRTKKMSSKLFGIGNCSDWGRAKGGRGGGRARAHMVTS